MRRELVSVEFMLSHCVSDPGTGCYLWDRSLDHNGYGQIVVGGKNSKAHRVMWELHNGPIPDGMRICHKCDNPTCFRPEHLFIGTPKDNAQDMISKGRHMHGDRHTSRTAPENLPRGSSHPNAKLTEAIVGDARTRAAAGETVASIALEYGVHRSVLGFAVTGRTWSHVQAPPVTGGHSRSGKRRI